MTKLTSSPLRPLLWTRTSDPATRGHSLVYVTICDRDSALCRLHLRHNLHDDMSRPSSLRSSLSRPSYIRSSSLYSQPSYIPVIRMNSLGVERKNRLAGRLEGAGSGRLEGPGSGRLEGDRIDWRDGPGRLEGDRMVWRDGHRPVKAAGRDSSLFQVRDTKITLVCTEGAIIVTL